MSNTAAFWTIASAVAAGVAAGIVVNVGAIMSVVAGTVTTLTILAYLAAIGSGIQIRTEGEIAMLVTAAGTLIGIVGTLALVWIVRGA